jgi:hypothetical protein
VVNAVLSHPYSLRSIQDFGKLCIIPNAVYLLKAMETQYGIAKEALSGELSKIEASIQEGAC